MVAPEVRFTSSPKMVVAYISITGAYSKVSTEMKRLKAWIDSRGIEQSGYPFCLFYDNPGETEESHLRSEVCIPVGKSFEGSGDVKVKEIQETQVAETRHQGPPEKFGETYGPFLEGLLNSGYQILGPAREFFMAVSDVRGPGSGFLIQQPIAK